MAIWKGNDSIGDIYTHVSLNNDYGRNDTFDRSWENMLYLTCRDWALNLLFFRFSIVPKVWFWWLHGEKKVRSWWKGFLWKGEHSGNPSEVYLDLPKCVKCCACSPKNETYQKAAFFCFYISRRSYGIFWVDQLEVSAHFFLRNTQLPGTPVLGKRGQPGSVIPIHPGENHPHHGFLLKDCP